MIMADHLAAKRLGIPAEEVARHRAAGRHTCVDGRTYSDSCLVTDPTCTSVARCKLHSQAPEAKPGDLIRVVAFAGSLDPFEKTRRTFGLLVETVTPRRNLDGWLQIEGTIVEPDQPRWHGRPQMVLAKPYQYDVLESERV